MDFGQPLHLKCNQPLTMIHMCARMILPSVAVQLLQ